MRPVAEVARGGGERDAGRCPALRVLGVRDYCVRRFWRVGRRSECRTAWMGARASPAMPWQHHGTTRPRSASSLSARISAVEVSKDEFEGSSRTHYQARATPTPASSPRPRSLDRGWPVQAPTMTPHREPPRAPLAVHGPSRNRQTRTARAVLSDAAQGAGATAGLRRATGRDRVAEPQRLVTR